jgi:threonine dehydrogenase-like Zn-dependent dehydrogenase
MSGKMMNAYRHKPTSDVAVHEVIPIPEPGQGEVLLKVAAAGLCHSEIHMFEHNTGVKFIDEGTFSFCHEMQVCHDLPMSI